MGLLSSIFGSSSASKSSVSTSQDYRTAVEGNVGQLIAPGAAVATPGSAAIQASGTSKVTANITNEGLLADDVKVLMDALMADAASERESFSSLGQSLASGIEAQAAKLGDIVEATKAPEQTALSSIVPLALVGVVLFFLFGGKR